MSLVKTNHDPSATVPGIERILAAARERKPFERAAFLDEACAGDEQLRKEVEAPSPTTHLIVSSAARPRKLLASYSPTCLSAAAKVEANNTDKQLAVDERR